MQRMWNTTLVQLFGPLAANVTVGHLLRMQSGIADFESCQPPLKFDVDTLKNGTQEMSPFKVFKFIADLPAPDLCRTGNCTFNFYPGTQIEYSSTGYMLAGMVLVGATPSDAPLTWQTLDIFKSLGMTKDLYPHTYFNPVGPADKQGLTVVGDDGIFGPDVPVFQQDCSIMGFTAGFCTSNARGIAQFYWDLFYKKTLVSQKSLDEMLVFRNLTLEGWTAPYGAGLFLSAAGTKCGKYACNLVYPLDLN